MKQSTADYLLKGGKINPCPPCDTLERAPRYKRIFHAPQNGHDKVLCADCRNKGRCENPCAPLTWIDGNVPRKENLINERMLAFEHIDYKSVIYDLYHHKVPQNRLEEIIEIPDLRKRAICAMLMARIPKSKISILLHISRTQLYRLVHSMLHSKSTISQCNQ